MATEAMSTSKRRCRILLGVTGSVAAVKGPELAVRLARDAHADVRVLLTAGGLNFWTKAQNYDPIYWNELQKRIAKKEGATTEENDRTEGRIYIHSE